MLGIIKSLLVTIETGRRKPVTRRYPLLHRNLPERARGLPLLLWDHEVKEPFCVGCHQCERACPVECITVTLKHNPKFETGESKRKTIVDEFFIDEGRCMRCNICAEVCPSNFRAITLTGSSWLTNEMAVYDRTNLVLDLDQLVSASQAGYSINPLTPEQNQLAPEGSRAWQWAKTGFVDGPQIPDRRAGLWARLLRRLAPSAWAKKDGSKPDPRGSLDGAESSGYRSAER